MSRLTHLDEATPYTAMDALASHDEDQRRDAIERLSRHYRHAIVERIRALGFRLEDAEDLAHDFFQEAIIGRRLFERHDREKGRLRNYLLVSIGNFVRNKVRRDSCRPGEEPLPSNVAVEDADHDLDFDAQWFTGLLRDAADRAQKDLVAKGKAAYWTAFLVRELRPALAGTDPPKYEDLARELHTTANHCAVMVKRVRVQINQAARAILAEQCDSPDLFSDEVERFNRVLSTVPAGEILAHIQKL